MLVLNISIFEEQNRSMCSYLLQFILCLHPITDEVGIKNENLLFVDSKTMLMFDTSIFEEQNWVNVFLLAIVYSLDLEIGETISGRDNLPFWCEFSGKPCCE